MSSKNDLTKINPSSEAGRRLQAEKMMSTELKVVSDIIEKCNSKSVEAELDGHWTIAQEISKVSENQGKETGEPGAVSYEEDALVKLAQRHGFDSAQIKSYLAVAEHIGEDIYERARKHNQTAVGRFGRITFTHLIQLSRITDYSEMQELLDVVESEQLSTIQLREMVNDKLKYDKAESSTETTTNIKPANVVKSTTKVGTKLLEVSAPIDTTEFANKVVHVVNHGSDKQMTKICESLVELDSALEAVIDQLTNRRSVVVTLKERVEKAVQARLARENGVDTAVVEEDQEELSGVFNEALNAATTYAGDE